MLQLRIDHTYTSFPDDDYEPNESFENLARDRFPSISSDTDPPSHGLAKLWLRNPEQWKVLDGAKWYCDPFTPTVIVQVFERGFAIGVFQVSPDATRNGIVYFLGHANNGRGSWISDTSDLDPTVTCRRQAAASVDQ
jgi:hypothetical protein